MILGLTAKFHVPIADTLPANVAFPTTLSVFKPALVILARLCLAVAMEALLTVASPMLAFGMLAVPVNIGLSMGAFNKFKEASDVLRSLISC